MEKFFVEKNVTSLPQEWQEAGDGWSNNAVVKIFGSENDFNEYICTQSNCGSIWISIDATDPNRNSYGGEFEFHSIFNNAPVYRNVNNIYLAYDGDEWYIMSEDRFLNGITGGWFRIETTGTLKNSELFKEILCRKKYDIVTTTMAGSH